MGWAADLKAILKLAGLYWKFEQDFTAPKLFSPRLTNRNIFLYLRISTEYEEFLCEKTLTSSNVLCLYFTATFYSVRGFK